MTRRASGLAVVFAFAATTACSSPAPSSLPDAGATPDAGRDASVADAGVPQDADVIPDGAGGDATDGADATDANDLDAGGACNALANNGPEVQEVKVATAAPKAAGGTLVPGLYVLTKWEVFAGAGGAVGPTGNVRRAAMQVAATTYDEVISDNQGTPQRATRAWSVSGTDFTSPETCPSNQVVGDGYTATPTTFVLQNDYRAFTFTRQ